ncbi:unnamed protein product [Cylicocyclus nassatus]|uniref:Nucleotide-diphospho-sugar transferase domain-containing protein n=1 Tax=Cylicocyclus nassatus TaxID=53992 RepID=A0AA36M526_CYLNA|nr:unnamed protein product [Cylicocyclus nassatus]
MRRRRLIFRAIVAFAIFSSIFIFYGVPSLINTFMDSMLRSKSYNVEELEYTASNREFSTSGSRSHVNIAIVMVVLGHKAIAIYQKAMLTVSCYARVQGYDFRILNSTHYEGRCPQKDGFFQRHCIVAHVLPTYDYILFLDADMGVANPKRRIEEYIDPKVDIIFYDRFYNWEITIGSYLVKNTSWSRDFLLNFAKYEERLPKSFHGTDNGAIHAYIAEIILGKNDVNLARCMQMYNSSKNWDDLFLYEACIRNILGNNTTLGKMKILPKGVAWARDNWITNSLWSLERDFIIHGWKENQLSTYWFTPVKIVSKLDDRWYNPLAGAIELSLCTQGNTSWQYDKNLLVSKNVIDRRLLDLAKEVEKKKALMLSKLQ